MKILSEGVRSVLKNGAFLMGFNWIDFGLGALYTVGLARYLGPDQFGIWAYGMATYGLTMGLMTLGFDNLIPVRLGVEKRDAADFLGLTLVLHLALLAVSALALVFYAFMGESNETSRLVLLIFVFALIGRGTSVWARVCFVAYERAGTYARIGTSVRTAEVCLGLLLLVTGRGLLWIAVLHSICGLIAGMVGTRFVHTHLTSLRVRFNRREILCLLKQGAILGLASALVNSLIAGPLILVRQVGNDLAMVGQLAIPLQAMMILFQSTLVYLVAALPVLSRSAQRQDQRVASYGKMTVLMGVMIGVPAGIIGVFFGPPAVHWLVGPEFEEAGKLLGPCLFICSLMLAPTGYSQVLLVKGYRWHGVLANGAGVVALLVGLPAAINVWGAEGAVLAIAIAWLLRAVVMVSLGLLLSGRHRQMAI